MVVMLVVVFAVVAVAVGAVVAWFIWRSGDEVHSVRHYHDALDTMEHLAGQNARPTATTKAPGRHDRRRGSAVVHVVTDGENELGSDHGAGMVGSAASRSVLPVPVPPVPVPPVPVRGNDEWPDPDMPLVFDDARPQNQPRRGSDEEPIQAFGSDHASRIALESMNREPRRLALLATCVVVVGAIGLLAFAGSRRSTHGSYRTTPRSAHRSHKATTSTTPSQITPVTSTATTATYRVPPGSYQVTVTASAPCWIDAVGLSSGSTVSTGTLQGGTQQVIDGTGAMSLELGSASATLSVGGVPVVFPAPMHAPFTATFLPSTTSSPSG